MNPPAISACSTASFWSSPRRSHPAPSFFCSTGLRAGSSSPTSGNLAAAATLAAPASRHFLGEGQQSGRHHARGRTESGTSMTRENAMNSTTHRQDAVQSAGDRVPVAYDRAPTFTGMIAEKDVAVPMRDGVNLSVDIYRPDDGGKFPALLAFAIYNKDLQGPDVANALPPQPAWSSLWAGPLEAGDTKFFVSRGYVHIIGSPRGVGKSDGGGSRQWDATI